LKKLNKTVKFVKKHNNLNIKSKMEDYSVKTFKVIKFALLIVSVIIVFCGNTVSANPNLDKEKSTVSNLRAEFRYGQVFLFWDEVIVNDQNLRIYLSKEPITDKNLFKAKLLTDQLEPHSANDWYDDPKECPRTSGPVHGWIIETGRDPLDNSGGLFVHTVLKEDPKWSYFAVLAEKENEDKLNIGVNSLQVPVSVKIGQIQAIWQSHEPKSTAKGKPLVISLHSHQSRPKDELTHLFFGDAEMGWREGLPFKFKITIRHDVVLLEPYDRVWINRRMNAEEAKANGTYDLQYKNIESWWYGTNDKINNPNLTSSGSATNYTERWLLWVMKWVQNNYKTNQNQVYAFGASMGTGILRLVLQNPDRFTSVDLLVPILDPFGEGNVGERMKPRIGEPQSICSDGIELCVRLNTINSIKATKTDLPPIVIRVGRTDKSVSWLRKPAFIRAVQGQKQSLFVGWDNGGHGNAMRGTYEGFPKWYDFDWYINHLALNMSYPAFTDCSLDNDPGDGNPGVGDSTGFINRGFDWKVIKDTKSSYHILLTIKLPKVTYPVYVNITPRHYRKFKNVSEATVYACNKDAEGKIIENKILVKDGDLITYDKFAITSPAGNTLLISKDIMK
jgi:hypothetical protein